LHFVQRAARLLGHTRLPAVTLAYLLIAVAVTFPFVLNAGNTLTAPLHADVASSVSEYQTLDREHQNPFLVDHFSTIGWPDGVTVTPTLARISWLNTLYLWISTLLVGAIPTHSILFILGMLVTALITCVLVRDVTGSIGAGFVAGIAFGFWPHMYLIGWAAPTYTWMWTLVLPLWAFYRLAISPTYRSGLLAGLSPLPAMFWTPYYALHVSVVAFACAVVVGVRAVALHQVSGSLLKRFAPAAAIPIAGIALYVLIGALSHFGGAPARSVADAYQESASPLMYVVPGWQSSWGNAPYNLLVRHVPRAQYANLYLGYTVIACAGIALVTTATQIWRHHSAALQSHLVVATLLAAVVVAFCFLFSLPPRLTFSGLSVPMPDDVVIHVQPAFRAGQRFVMPLMGGMAVLAGLGVYEVVRRLPHRAVPVFVVLVAALMWVDLFARPPEAVNQLPQFAALAALRGEPPGPVFQYIPLQQPDRFQGIRACLLQPQYDKPLADTCDITNQHQNYVEWTTNPGCASLQSMREAGVRYVIIDDSLKNLIACMGSELTGHNRRVADDGKLSVYELT
jgi:hypothetical protein